MYSWVGAATIDSGARLRFDWLRVSGVAGLASAADQAKTWWSMAT
jgi:hypothetical protein